MEAKIRVMQEKLSNNGGDQKLEEASEDYPLETLKGTSPCQHLDFDIKTLILDIWTPKL